jgi:hypothetical protein
MRRMIALVVVIILIAVFSVGLAFVMFRVNRPCLLLSGKVSEIEECPQREARCLESTRWAKI